MKKSKVTIVATSLLAVTLWGSVGVNADSVEQAQKQVKQLSEQSENLVQKKEKLISDNKTYQAELLKTQKELVGQKEKMADFVHNVQASDMSQGYIKMVMSSKSLKQLIRNINVANNFARVNQSSAKTLEKTAEKLNSLAEKNNTTIANITRQEKSIEETLKAKQQLVSNIEQAQADDSSEVESVEVPEPKELSPEPKVSANKASVADIISSSPIASQQPDGSGSSGSGQQESNQPQNQEKPSPAPVPSQPDVPTPPPAINFVKMPSDGIGFDGGQCTYGADAMLGGDVPNWWGNAVNWFENARAQGLPTGSTPVAGALVIYGANANIGGYLTGYQGHVALVQSVQGSNIVVKEMNGTAGEWKYNIRTGSSTSGVIGYIYIK